MVCGEETENIVIMKDVMEFYSGKKILVTGHTGFKGSWMTTALLMAGADITGYSLVPPTDPSLFELLGLDRTDDGYPGTLTNVYGDIRDIELLKKSGFSSVNLLWSSYLQAGFWAIK